MAKRGRQPKHDVAKYIAMKDLDLVVAEMGDKMYSANKQYIADGGVMTPNQSAVWAKYQNWCKAHPDL